MTNQTAESEKIDIEQFASMVGFPKELITKELFNNNIEEDELSMAQLREAMLKYLDKTMA